jgi:hypothetical protein
MVTVFAFLSNKDAILEISARHPGRPGQQSPDFGIFQHGIV